MKYLVAFDPGGTTGWCLAQYDDDIPMTFIAGGQIPDGVDGFVKWFWDIIMAEGYGFPPSQIKFVSESFVLDGRTKKPDLTPVRIEGALSALLPVGSVTYQRNTAKSLVGDSGLVKLGFWVPGQRHHMDARLHALGWAKKNHYPSQEAYWPEAED